ncbi:MAG: hypothetical protein AAF928_21060, partial [Myxococcota bacterium]
MLRAVDVRVELPAARGMRRRATVALTAFLAFPWFVSACDPVASTSPRDPGQAASGDVATPAATTTVAPSGP